MDVTLDSGHFALGVHVLRVHVRLGIVADFSLVVFVVVVGSGMRMAKTGREYIHAQPV